MLSASKIKLIRSLSLKKFRKQYGLFIAEGDKTVKELPASDLEITEILALPQWIENNTIPATIPITPISPKELQRISALSTPNQAVAMVKIPDHDFKKVEPAKNLVLILDNIQDPGNLGTIIRTADWFGIKDVICSPETADIYNPKVIQATMGSFARVKVYYNDPRSVLQRLPQGTPVLGATLQGKSIHKTNLPSRGILITGNESKGISKELYPFITDEIFIPGKSGNKGADSLNAAVATGIILSAIIANRG